jgi:Tol biopolymer transport system component
MPGQAHNHLPRLAEWRRLAPALPCLLLGLLLAAPAEATSPGRDGAVVFSRHAAGPRNAPSDLWVATRSGEQRRLTASRRASETEAAFSPNGRTIAYTRRVGENTGIWLMNADGSHKRQLVDTRLNEFSPSFFPSGESLAFTTFEEGARGRWEILSIRTDGSALTRLVEKATEPEISPDGRWLAYLPHDGQGIRLRDLRGGETVQLTMGMAAGPDFSPDGSRIAYLGRRPCGDSGMRAGIVIADLDGGPPRWLPHSCGKGFVDAVWSPSGKRLLLTRIRAREERLPTQLKMFSSTGVPLPGAPRHMRGTDESSPTWQPLH